MATIGTVPVFEPEQSSFEEWTEILSAFCVSNDIDDDTKKRAILLTSVGTKTYHILRSLLPPHKPTDKTFDQCVAVLKGHFCPQPNQTVLRYRFYTRCQKPDESIAKFVADLRRLSEGCEFPDLDNMLRDRSVVGCQDQAIQRRLLSDHNLTF